MRNDLKLQLLRRILSLRPGESCELKGTENTTPCTIAELADLIGPMCDFSEQRNREGFLIAFLKHIDAYIADGKTTITSKERDTMLSELRHEYATGRLIDFAGKRSYNEREDEAYSMRSQRPYFVRQLELLHPETHLGWSSLILDAVMRYRDSETNLQRWLDDELYTKDDLKEYERELLDIHKSESRRIPTAEETADGEVYGLETFRKCCDRGRCVKLNDKSPCGHLAEGTFHRLADCTKDRMPSLGWHPRWDERLPPEQFLKGELP